MTNVIDFEAMRRKIQPQQKEHAAAPVVTKELDPLATIALNADLVREQLDDITSEISVGLRTLRRLGIDRKTFEARGDAFEETLDEVLSWLPRSSSSREGVRHIIMVRPEQAQTTDELMRKFETLAREIFLAVVVAHERQCLLRALDLIAETAAPEMVALAEAVAPHADVATAHDEATAAHLRAAAANREAAAANLEAAAANRQALLALVARQREFIDAAGVEIAAGKLDQARALLARAGVHQERKSDEQAS